MRRAIEMSSMLRLPFLCRCPDPPAAGTIALDIDRTATRAGFTAVDFVVEQVAVFYDGGLPALGEEDVSCTFPGAIALPLPAPVPVHLDLSTPGRTFVGGLTLHAGNVTAIWLLVRSITVDLDGGTVPAHGRKQCELGGASHDADGELGILRLVPTANQSIVVVKDGNVEAAAAFDPNTAILSADEADDDEREAGPSDARDAGDDHGDYHDSGDDHGKDDGARAPDLSLASLYPLTLVPPAEDNGAIPGQLTVRFHDGTAPDTIAAAIAATNASVVRVWNPTNYYTLQIPTGADEAKALRYYAGRADVDYTLPNFTLLPATMVPNDPTYAAGGTQPAWDQVHAGDAWQSLGGGGSALPILAVVDTGVDLTQPDLIGNIYVNPGEIPYQRILQRCGLAPSSSDAAVFAFLDRDHDGVITFDDLNDPAIACACPTNPNIAHPPQFPQCVPLDLVNGIPETQCDAARGFGWQDGCDNDGNGRADDIVGWDFVHDNNLAMPSSVPAGVTDSCAWHGTGMASIAAARGNNAIGMAGVSWRARILPLRVFQSSIVAGANGPELRCNAPDDLLHHAISYAQEHFVAAGTRGLRRADVINVSIWRVLQSSSAGAHGISSRFAPFSPVAITPGVKVALVRNQAVKEYLDLSAGDAVIVTGGGNGGVSLDFPDDLIVYPGSVNLFGLNVANVTSSDVLAVGSDFGVGVSGKSAGTQIAAPGDGAGDGIDCLGPQGRKCDGASASAAMVSGGLLLVLSADPTLASQPCHLRNRLERNADTIPGLVGFVVQGRRLNLASAVADANQTAFCGSVP